MFYQKSRIGIWSNKLSNDRPNRIIKLFKLNNYELSTDYVLSSDGQILNRHLHK